MTLVNRRNFLAGAAATFAMADTRIPVIDTHIHLFDTTRPQGVPWPDKKDTALFKPALPDRYRKLALPHGIVGAIEVEASPWLEDNQWVLDIAAKDPLLVGTVGDLEPGKPEFAKQLERFHRNKLFRGIRYGNLWDRDLSARLNDAAFVADLKLLASTGLVLDTANPDPKLVAAVVRVTDLVPNLRVVVDHLAQLNPPSDKAALRTYEHDLQELGKRPQVYVKISQVLRREHGVVSVDPAFYKPRIDALWNIFGEDRLLYGSDWPNSDLWGSYDQVFRIVHDYFMAKGRAAAEKYFWKNSLAAYRWVKRDASQPG